MTPPDMAAHYAAHYGFRPIGPFEAPGEYRAALIAHVQARDYAAAFELRLGRWQADWTPLDVQAFQAFTQGERSPGTPPAPLSFLLRLPVARLGQFEATEASLVRCAEATLATARQRRTRKATVELPIVTGVMLLSGDVAVYTIGRADRIAVLKGFAQRFPLFGFFVVADAFLHLIEKEGAATATKTDALVLHIGTREMRRMVTHAYRPLGKEAVFHAEPRVVDVRAPGPHTHIEDPYAEIFVSVPTPGGVQ